MKNILRTVKILPTMNILCGFLHLKPTAGCQILTFQELQSVKDPDNTFELNPK
jgi:hypothetical protein